MSTTLRLTPEEYDQMIAKGAFERLGRRVEMIRGELREMNPAGPVHDDYVDYLTRWSTNVTTSADCVVRVQLSIDLRDSRPEPDVTWLKPGRYATRRPAAADVLLLIEVADSSLANDLGERTRLFAEFGVGEYWVVDVAGKCLHVFANPRGDRYLDHEVINSGGTVAPNCNPDVILELSELFAEG